MRTLSTLVLLVACKKSPEQAPSPPPPAPPATPLDATSIDAPNAVDAAAPDAAIAAGPAPIDEDKLLDTEHLGALKFGARFNDVVAAVGPPAKKTRAQIEGATGQYVYTASWPLLVIEFAADQARDPGTARLLTVRDPALSTARGIHVGSTLAELSATYPKSKEQQQDPTHFLVGSPYGGLLFTVAKGQVTEIAVGPFAF